MSEAKATKFKISGLGKPRVWKTPDGKDVPIREFLSTIAFDNDDRVVDVAVSVMGYDTKKLDGFEVGSIIEMKEGMTLENKGKIRSDESDFVGKTEYRLKFPRTAYSGGGGRSFGGGRPPATEMDLDTYIGLKLTVYKEFHDGLTKIVDPRAYAEVATIAGTMANGTIMDMNIKPTVKGPKMPPAVEDKPPF